MSPEMLTALLRAANDGVIPAPLAGEDIDDFRLRCAMAGASVALVQMQAQAAASEAKAPPPPPAHPDPFSPTNGHGGRPGDVLVTSQPSPDNPVQWAVAHDQDVGVD